MQAGVTGARYPTIRNEPLEFDIRKSQIREMIAIAQADGFDFGPNPDMPERMSLAEAFDLLAAGQLNLDDPESPIRFPRPAEQADAVDQNPTLAGRPLLVIDNGMDGAMRHRRVCDLTYNGPAPREPAPMPRRGHYEESSEYQSHRGHSQYDEDAYVEVNSSRPPRVTIHEVDEDFDPRQLEEQQPMPRGRREEHYEDEMPPMPRGRGDEPRFDERFERLQPDMRVQGEPRAERIDGAARAEKAEAPGADAAGKALKVGRVTLEKADMAEIKAIAKKLDIDPRIAAKCLRAPTTDERLLARGPQAFSIARDTEARERIVTLDPKDGGPYAVISLAPKAPARANLWSAALHGVSLLPGVGGLFQAGAGALTFGAGIAGSLIGPLAKQEHNLNLMRTGIKHALWGVANAFIDFTSAGAAWLPRAIASVGGGALDVTQFFKSRKSDGQAGFVIVDKDAKPTPIQRLGGLLDTAVDKFATAIKR